MLFRRPDPASSEVLLAGAAAGVDPAEKPSHPIPGQAIREGARVACHRAGAGIGKPGNGGYPGEPSPSVAPNLARDYVKTPTFGFLDVISY
jgi:hypothetical protein